MRPGLLSRRDRRLREELEQDRGVQQAQRKLRELSSGWGFVQRRGLLASSLRLTRSMSPGVADALARCREVLDFHEPVEVFVRPEPVFNAFCLRSPAGPLVIGLSSRILEAFTPGELAFVLGHELGHAAFDHVGLPMPALAKIEDLAGTIVSHPVALKLYLWCRAAEISADRAGLACCEDPQAAATAFFKLTSGMASGFLAPDLDAFARQVDALALAPSARRRPDEADDSIDAFSTHPFSPLRVRALVSFARSAAWAGSGPSLDEVEDRIEADLSVMDPSYLEEKGPAAERLRDALYAAGMEVAAAHGGVEPREEAALRALLGAGGRPLSPEAAHAALPGLLQRIRDEEPVFRRAQLVQHLVVVAAADGAVPDEEMEVLLRVALALGVDPQVINLALEGASHPMD